MKKILFVILVSIFLFSCKKNKTELFHKIEGVTLDSRAIAYPEIANVDLLLEEQVLEGGVFNGAFTELATTKSDQLGIYEFSFDKRTTLEYRLTATKADYFPYQSILNPNLIKPGITYDKNVNLKAKAWLNTKIINENSIDEYDQIIFKLMNATFDCNCCSNESNLYQGMDIDETNTCAVYGNTWIKYLTTITRTGSPSFTSIDSIYCNSFDTTFVEIHF